MPKKKNQGVARVLNPPFDPRMRDIGPPGHHKGLKRGRIVMADPHPETGVRHALRFMYNPISVEVSHNASMAIVNDPSVQQNQQGQQGNAVGIGDTSFSLYFDRTYETWDRSKAKTLAGKYGVYADVLAFYQLLNITPVSKDYTYSTKNGKRYVSSTIWHSLYPTNAPAYTLAYVYVGQTLKYYGQISSLNVTYSHFTQTMVPNRGVVTLNLALQTDPNVTKRGRKTKVTKPQGGKKNPKSQLPGGSASIPGTKGPGTGKAPKGVIR